ncbi:hypothetical protein P7B02_10140 [Caulobacter segnis]|uniref:hypothetical protein n=1 Tax=Caulobacter segnis TaxID=88688 RepID=UPI00241015DB|nr:hypothetical protein [Caulobacter segnis]MDG2521903.1 hypothetical protein [Caulobacter segnis]
MSADTLVDLAPIEPPPEGRVPKGAEQAIAEWRRKGPTNLFTACPELKPSLPKTVRAATAEDFAAVRKGRPASSLFITGIMAPFISRDGRYIINSQRYHCSGLCGGVTATIRTRQAGGWSKRTIIFDVMS